MEVFLMNRKQKRSLFKIIISIILFAAAMILTHTVLSLPWFGEFALFAAIYLICGLNPIRKAVINISHGQIFDENFLMCIATIGAFTIGEFHEAVEVMIFYQIGQLFESIAVGRSRKAVSDLRDICPDEAVVIRDGVRETVPADEIEVCGVRGMGIRRGVTVITGGGYSGKSTLLDAISAGIYDHIAGDGRELVITDNTAVTISAEDGRSVKNVNISSFIKWIPGGNPADFSTERASGSTSQAANIVEAVSYGAKLLLIDEDKSATNFMIRDKMMKELIEKEPITPFTDRVNELYRRCGVSTILVIGGSGEYLSVADKIYQMDDFIIHDATETSKEICRCHGVTNELPEPVDWSCHRTLLGEGFTSYPADSGTERLEVSDMGFIFIGNERVDIRMLHNIVSPEQLTALGFMLRQLEVTNNSLKIDMVTRIDELYRKLEAEGLDSVYSGFFTTCERFMELPRKQELIAVINRMRYVHFRNG